MISKRKSGDWLRFHYSDGGQNAQDQDLDTLAALLAPQESAEVQTAAAQTLGKLSAQSVPDLLLAGWQSHTPALRSQILDSLMAREASILSLLNAIEKGTVPASQIDARRRQQLLTDVSAKVREKAEKVLAGAVDANRAKIIEQYKPALTGDRRQGEGKSRLRQTVRKLPSFGKRRAIWSAPICRP